jgi:hypothetical protein
VKETSAQKADTIIPEVPQIDETSSHIEIPVNAIPFVSDDIGIDRSRYRDTHIPSKKNDIDKALQKDSRNSQRWRQVFLAHSRLFLQSLLE